MYRPSSYRSHLHSACFACRKRKSRCRFGAADQATCLMCQTHGTECLQPNLLSRESRAAHPRPVVQQQLTRQTSSTLSTASATAALPLHPSSATICSTPIAAEAGLFGPYETPFPTSSTLVGDREGDEGHVVGPVQNSDAQRIANYLLNNPVTCRQAAQIVVPLPEQFHLGLRPILFNTVRRHPLGYRANQTDAAAKCEIVENLVTSFHGELIDLYFQKLNFCFPILDEQVFRSQYVLEKHKISPALLSCLYAHTMVYWRHSESAGRQCPDVRFIWTQANQALNSELYSSPGLSTIAAILLNISGRPLTSMIGNGVLLSSAISLAHSLGLNRNCMDWNISTVEKCIRTKLWWVIVIYDKWSSVTYGTPPQLRTAQNDVTCAILAQAFQNQGSVVDESATSAFVALAELTDVLDPYIDHVFDLRDLLKHDSGSVGLEIQRRLTGWEDSLPNQLKRAVIRGIDLRIAGSANLRLAYLFIRLLNQKLSLNNVKNHSDTNAAMIKHCLIRARQAAEEIVIFVQELDDESLSDFWLSFNAFSLSGTVAFLVRSALEEQETAGENVRSRFLELASDMISSLRSHQERMAWDLGNICVAQYSHVLEKLMATDSHSPDNPSELQQFVMSDLIDVDQLSPSLWDLFKT